MIVLYIFLAVVILLFMVLIHELGHYTVGRLLHFKIDEFSVGFGKAIVSHTNKRGEKISLRIFPLGGYCAFAGEDGLDKDGNPMEGAFTSQKPWKRILVFFAGVTFNFLTAIIFSFILLVSVGYDIPEFKNMQTKTYEYVEKYETSSNFDSQQNSLLPGDVILSVNGAKIDFAYSYTFPDLITRELNKLTSDMEKNGTEFAQHKPLSLRVRRNGESLDINLYFSRVLCRSTNDKGEFIQAKDKEGNLKIDSEGQPIYETYYSYGLGGYFGENAITKIEGSDLYKVVMTFPEYKPYRHTFGEALARCIPFAFGLAWVVLKSLGMLFASIFTLSFDASMVGGPIATIATIASVTQQNALNLLILIPLISANLAVFNILPIPALDGAHVVFTIIEWIRGKPISRKVENMIHTIGLIVLFGLVILVDILHFVLPLCH